MPPIVDKQKCNTCGYCVQICPLDVLRIEKKREGAETIVKYPDECWHCRACEKDCPQHAITMRYPLSHMMLHITPQKKGDRS
ncbi:MAG: ferredoxin family protein [Eubacterium sp.]